MANSIHIELDVNDKASTSIQKFSKIVDDNIRKAALAHKVFATNVQANMKFYATSVKTGFDSTKKIIEEVNQLLVLVMILVSGIQTVSSIN